MSSRSACTSARRARSSSISLPALVGMGGLVACANPRRKAEDFVTPDRSLTRQCDACATAPGASVSCGKGPRPCLRRVPPSRRPFSCPWRASSTAARRARQSRPNLAARLKPFVARARIKNGTDKATHASSDENDRGRGRSNGPLGRGGVRRGIDRRPLTTPSSSANSTHSSETTRRRPTPWRPRRSRRCSSTPTASWPWSATAIPRCTGIAASSLAPSRTSGDEASLQATLVDNDNVVWTALYSLSREENGDWLISGCVLVKPEASAIVKRQASL